MIANKKTNKIALYLQSLYIEQQEALMYSIFNNDFIKYFYIYMNPKYASQYGDREYAYLK